MSDHPQITHISIRNFKSIKQLDLDLSPFMVLVGPNGSGKTNFVQALSLVGEMLQRGTTDPIEELGWDTVIRREKKPARSGLHLGLQVRVPLQHRIDHNTAIIVKIGLVCEGKKNQNTVAVLQEELSVWWEGRQDDVFSIRIEQDEVQISRIAEDPRLVEMIMASPLGNRQRGDRNEPWSLESIREHFSVRQLRSDEERRYLRLLSMPRFYSNLLRMVADTCRVRRFRLDASRLREVSATRAQMDTAGSGLASDVARLRGTGERPKAYFESSVLEPLRRIFPRLEDIRPIRIQPGQLALQFKERGMLDPLGQHGVSDGILHALALLIALSDRGAARSAGVLAVEEPENAVHPWSIRVLMERMQKERRTQILLTTHSVTVVDAVNDPANLFVADVDAEHGTRIVRATTRESALRTILRETGQQLGELWLEGAIGGIPGSPA